MHVHDANAHAQQHRCGYGGWGVRYVRLAVVDSEKSGVEVLEGWTVTGRIKSGPQGAF